MSMNRILTLGLLAITAAVGAAQANVQATFHLPVGAHWGQTTLAPGDYKISIPDDYRATPRLILQGNGTTGYVQPQLIDPESDQPNVRENSYLKLEKVNGAFFVTEYRSGSIGETFHFLLPKQPRHHSPKTERDVVKIGVGGN